MTQLTDFVRQAYEAQFQQFFADQDEAAAPDLLLFQVGGPLEPFAMPNLQASENREGMPLEMLAAYDFYAAQDVLAAAGADSLYGATLLVGEHITFAVYAQLDPGEGCLEVYDIEGNLLGAAHTQRERLCWEAVEAVRDRLKTLAPL